MFTAHSLEISREMSVFFPPRKVCRCEEREKERDKRGKKWREMAGNNEGRDGDAYAGATF